MAKRELKAETLVGHLGRNSRKFDGAVNPPVYHASTILFESLEAFEDRGRHFGTDKATYGRSGTPTTFALEDTIARLEGGAGTVAVSSGLGAVVCSLLAFVEAGDHILVSDSVYAPTRKFCDGMLRRLGVETTYFDPFWLVIWPL